MSFFPFSFKNHHRPHPLCLKVFFTFTLLKINIPYAILLLIYGAFYRRIIMDLILCSNEFKKFFDNIQGNISNMDEMMLQLNIAMKHIEDTISLGSIKVDFEASMAMTGPFGQNFTKTVYEHKDGYENSPISKEYITGENSVTRFFAYPRKGHVWSPEEEQAVHFLLDNIFIIMGRTRLAGIAKQASFVDPLTGVHTSAGIMVHIGSVCRREDISNYAGIFLNIKNFKYINKVAGEKCGNDVMIAYSNNIRTFLGDNGVIGRLGGDNFYIFVKKDFLDEVINFLTPFSIDVTSARASHRFQIYCRMGIYFPTPKDTVDDMISRSSIALNNARATSVDQVYFNHKMLDKVMHQKEISSNFQSALDNQEFEIYYQPKVTLEDNSICGGEALVRWIKSDILIPPMEFIPVLEQEGTICKLDLYVLDKVCSHIRSWIDMGISPVKISVNLSKKNLDNFFIIDDIIKTIDNYNVPHEYIEIEITEMSGYEDYNALAKFVTTMNQHGITTSLDDFGSGYSSLNLLKDLAVDVIKLDRSLLGKLAIHEKCDEIVLKNVINMINELEMTVIAEGVETEDQASFLKKMNCAMAQGFLFDKPLPQEEFIKRLTGERAY